MTIKISKICSDLTKQIEFVAKVLNKKERGTYGKHPNCILFDENEKRLVATDGHRMHYADLDDDSMAAIAGAGMENGTYNIIASTKNEIILEKTDVHFPNYKEIIPNIAMAKCISEFDTNERFFNVNLLKMLYGFPEKTYFDLDFFRGLIVKNNWTVYGVYWFDKESAIMFQSKESPKLNCLMMPLNV